MAELILIFYGLPQNYYVIIAYGILFLQVFFKNFHKQNIRRCCRIDAPPKTF